MEMGATIGVLAEDVDDKVLHREEVEPCANESANSAMVHLSVDMRRVVVDVEIEVARADREVVLRPAGHGRDGFDPEAHGPAPNSCPIMEVQRSAFFLKKLGAEVDLKPSPDGVGGGDLQIEPSLIVDFFQFMVGEEEVTGFGFEDGPDSRIGLHFRFMLWDCFPLFVPRILDSYKRVHMCAGYRFSSILRQFCNRWRIHLEEIS